MKRLVTFGLALALIGAVIGCEPSAMPNPTVTPLTTPHTSPVVPPATPMTTAPNVTPSVNGTASNQQTMTIPDFKEGTAVMMTDIPLVRNAFEERYKDYSVVGVTHAMQGNEQVYRIEYKDAQGNVEQAFIRPGGAWYDDNIAAPASVNTVE